MRIGSRHAIGYGRLNRGQLCRRRYQAGLSSLGLFQLAMIIIIVAAAGAFLPECRGWVVVTMKMPLEAEWRQLPVETPRIQPPRSGHASFIGGGDGKGNKGAVYVFGGYAEHPITKERRAVNDLWQWQCQSTTSEEGDVPVIVGGGWHPVRFIHGEKNSKEGEEEDRLNLGLPRARLVSAAAVLGNQAYLVGGWDPGTPGTGGDILKSCHRLDLNQITVTTEASDKGDDIIKESISSPPWTRLRDFPDGSTSRHVAVTVDIGGEEEEGKLRSKMILVHNHRCNRHVWTLREGDDEFQKQPTTGVAPSSRGLHAAAVVAGNKLVVFGGAAQEGQMSNEVFVLDASTWTWSQPCSPENSRRDSMLADGDAVAPCPRAAPCLAAFDDDTLILYGGAEATPQGLMPLGDVWAFHLTLGTWQLLLPDDQTPNAATPNGCPPPPPRNAATLSCIASSSASFDAQGSTFYRDYLLTGGWHPFVETRDDCYVLRVWRR